MTKITWDTETRKRLEQLATSSIVGADIRAALKHVDELTAENTELYQRILDEPTEETKLRIAEERAREAEARVALLMQELHALRGDLTDW